MKVFLKNQDIEITATGIEFLKLKTEINKRLGNVKLSKPGTINIPVSTLPLIEDLLSQEAKSMEDIKKCLQRFKAHSIARLKAIEIIEQNINDGLPERWSSVLDPAQATAVAAMTIPDLLGLCLFDEQGSGKTVMSIAAFDILREKNFIDKMIIVCPKSMISEWPKDLQKFLPEKYKVIQAEGNKQQKYEASLENFDVLVANYEGVEVMLTSLIATSTKYKYLLVADESYYLKNGESARSGNVLQLRQYCKYCFVLCGTPAPNSAHDLIHQFDLSDLGYTFAGFLKSKDSSNDLERITELIYTKGLFIRRLKTEILSHVPEKNFHVIRVSLKGRQALMYDKARSELELTLKTLDNETFKKKLVTYFQQRAVLLQICCCPSAIDPTLTEMSVKYEVLDALITDLITSGRKVILWSFFRKSLDELMIRYFKYNPVRVDGSVSTISRRAAVKSFQEDPNIFLFIGNPAAAGAGITLHASYDAIYLSYSNQAAHYLQSLDRIHRRGQMADQVNYYLIVCKNTIEETEIVRLRGKEIRQHNLLGDHIPWPTSLDDALQELSQYE